MTRSGYLILLMALLLAACQPDATGPAITNTGLMLANAPVEEKITGPDQEHHWVFTGTEGEVISILFRSEDNLASLSIRNPDGSILREIRGNAYQNSVKIDSILPTTGNYAVVIAMDSAGSTMYRVTLLNPNDPETATAPPTASEPEPVETSVSVPSTTPVPQADLGIIAITPLPPRIGSGARLNDHQPILGEISDAGSSERYTIVGKAGDIITVGAEAFEGSNLNPHLTVYAPSGEILAENDNAFGTFDALLVGVELPASGAYVVFVRDSAGLATGSYTLSFGYGLTMKRQAQERTEPDTVITGLLNSPATQDAWPIALNIGDIISVAVVVDDNSGLDPVVQLVSPGGETVYVDDNSGGGRNAALREIIAPASGEFYLTVAPALPDSFGPYTLIWRFDARTPGTTQ